jgi:hypothetical protein
MKVYGGFGCIDPRFLYLGTSWRRVVSFTTRPLYPEPMSPQTLDKRLGWLIAGLEDVKKGVNLHLPGLELRPLGCTARSQ